MMAEYFNHFAEISVTLERAVSAAVRKVAFDIQANAASYAPVDTGFLRASIYTVTSTRSTYGQGRPSKHGGKFNAAKMMNQEQLPEVAAPDDNMTAYVAVGASYGIYVEEGTRDMPAQPYFYPAVDVGQATLDAALAAIEVRLSRAALSGSVEVDEE